MLNKEDKNAKRKKRHLRSRKNVIGTATRPRLNVFRSLGNIYAQVINDETGVTLVSASTIDKEIKASVEYGGNIEAAKIDQVVFDRGGCIYHGRIAALATAAREAGLEF